MLYIFEWNVELGGGLMVLVVYGKGEKENVKNAYK